MKDWAKRNKTTADLLVATAIMTVPSAGGPGVLQAALKNALVATGIHYVAKDKKTIKKRLLYGAGVGAAVELAMACDQYNRHTVPTMLAQGGIRGSSLVALTEGVRYVRNWKLGDEWQDTQQE